MNPFRSRALFNNMFHMADLMAYDMERQFARAWRSIDRFERQALRDQQRYEQRLQLQEQQAQKQQKQQQQQLKSENKEQKQEQQQQKMQPEKKEVKPEPQQQQQQQKQMQMQPQRQQEIQFRDIFDEMEYEFERAFRDPFGQMDMFMRDPFFRPSRHFRERHQQQEQKPQEQQQQQTQQTQQMQSEQKEVKQEQQVQAEKKEAKPEKQEQQQQETQVQPQNQQQIQFRNVFDELEYEFDRAWRDPFGFSPRFVRPPVYETEKNLLYRMVKTIDQNGNVKVETVEKEPGSEWKITTEEYKLGDKAVEGNKAEAQGKVEEKVQEKVEGQEKPKAISESA